MYRVKEVDGIFIPQRLCFIGWLGIDTKDKYLWFVNRYQITYCCYEFLEGARERIESYKIQIKKPKPKYHYGK